MHGPREVLNTLKWREHALAEARIHYVHRGAPGDVRVAPGEAVLELGPSFLTLSGPRGPVAIPYHRVFRIDRGGATIWRRRDAPGGPATGKPKFPRG